MPMITQQAQIKINLPLPLKDFIESKASQYGLPVTTYIKHLIMKEVEAMDYPVFEASEKTIKAGKKALKNRHKAIRVTDIDSFFESL